MSELNSFGSVMAFAIDLENKLQAYYAKAGNDTRAKDTEKRRVKLERIRRENIVEITLEPIDDLYETDYVIPWDDTSPDGQKQVEQVISKFFSDAAPKINVLPAQRALEKFSQEHKALSV